MLTKVLGTLGTTVTLVALSTISPIPAEAATFNLLFDNSFPNYSGVTPPFTGTGTLSYQGDIQTGQFSLSSIPGLNFNFTVNGATFTTADLVTNLDTAFLLVQAIPGGYQAFLGGVGGFRGGSVDFGQPGGSYFTFEPSYYDGNLDQYQQGGPTSYFAGSYQAISRSVPEPTTLLGLAAVGIGLIATKRKFSSTAQ